MPSKKMSRTAYRDPTQVGQPVRSGDTTHGESNLDVEGYVQSLEAAHASGLHDWGVAQGLRTSATIGAAGITVEPGIAIDVNGRHIAVAAGGSGDASYAEVATVDPPEPAVPALITATGVTLPTATAPLLPAGDYVVTVQYLEAFDIGALASPTGAVWRYNYTPWLRLRPAGTFADNGDQVPLARVTLDGTGKVTALTHGVRRVVGVPVQGVRLRAGQTTTGGGKTHSGEAEAAELRVRRGAGAAPAGVELVSANATDEIHLKAKGATAGTSAPVAKIELSAASITARGAAGTDTVSITSASGDLSAIGTIAARQGFVARRADGKATVVIDAQNGNLIAGTTGVVGDVLVKDEANLLTVCLDGGAGDVVVGGTGKHGNVRVWNSNRVERINLDATAGDVIYAGKLRETGNTWHAGVTHAQLREVTGGGFTTLHRHLNSGNASRARALWMFADNGTARQTVTFSSPRHLFACIAVSSINPRHSFDSGDGMFAEIYRVDGTDFRGGGVFTDGGHFGPDGDDANLRRCFFSGTAQSVEFRLRSTQDASVWALALVFPENA